MPARPPATFDVFLRAADTVYRAVPLQVVLGWAEQGRLAPKDGLRPGDTEGPWTAAADHPTVGDYLPRPKPKRPEPPLGMRAAVAATAPTAETRPLDVEEPDFAWNKALADDDDDVDMIPLIDISLVLLIFFMMTSAVAAVSPIDVPGLQNAAEFRQDAEALTVMVDKRPGGQIYYGVRVGERPPEKQDTDLATLGECLVILDTKIAQSPNPPEVRLAVHKTLTYAHVRELSVELAKRREQKKIASFAAEVNEAKK